MRRSNLRWPGDCLSITGAFCRALDRLSVSRLTAFSVDRQQQNGATCPKIPCRINCGSGLGSAAGSSLGQRLLARTPNHMNNLAWSRDSVGGAAMSAIGSIDWTFLEFFFGDPGRIAATVIVLLLTT